MTSDPRVKAIGEIKTAHLLDIVIDLKPRLNIGGGPLGQRILFGAAGGSFEGPRLRGEVLAGGGDWALFRSDGAMMLDVRLTLRTHDDALVHMTYGGRWMTPPELRADIADPVKRYLPDQPSVRNRGEAIRLAERHRLRRVGLPDRRRHCLQSLSGYLTAACLMDSHIRLRRPKGQIRAMRALRSRRCRCNADWCRRRWRRRSVAVTTKCRRTLWLLSATCSKADFIRRKARWSWTEMPSGDAMSMIARG
jgi:Protein of unknown function (DUF3237)